MPPTAAINQSLPSDCFYHIFSRVPSLDLIRTVPLVCGHWYRLQPESCRRARSINLSEMELNERMAVSWPESTLRTSRLWPTVARELVARFPRIQQLQLYSSVRKNPDDIGMSHLLEHWSSHLVSFRLYYRNRSPNGLAQFDRIIHLLNARCIALKRLNFCFLIYNIAIPQLDFDLPLVSRLERLQFATRPSNYQSLVRALGTHGNLETMKLLKVSWSRDDAGVFLESLSNWPSTNPIHRAARFVRNLSIEMSSVCIDNLSSHLPHLRRLNVTIRQPEPLWGYSHQLSRPTQLDTLEIRFMCYDDHEMIAEPRCSELFPLNSVRNLVIKTQIFEKRHTWMEEMLRPGRLLPNLNTVNCDIGVHYLYYECRLCNVVYPYEIEWGIVGEPTELQRRFVNTVLEPDCPIAACFQAALAPFDACGNLTKRLLTMYSTFLNAETVQILERTRIEKGLLPGWQFIARKSR